jgi:regulatory protein
LPELSAKQAAVKLLTRREHSASEIQHKLQQRDFDPREIAEALVALQRDGWQSDERYAEAYTRSRRLRGYGPIRIAMELKERGVDESLAATCIAEQDEHWLETLRAEYRKKYRGAPYRDYAEKAKRMRYLQYRGFSLDAIHQVVSDSE